ncbi:hypothetical protein C4K27_0985 [Pseudomonas chlororaphis subsp. chlororaphis]|nr:hypothetical protein C4K27_0985 [Pseudomonas chlororaphis subsp. chlororaphis]
MHRKVPAVFYGYGSRQTVIALERQGSVLCTSSGAGANCSRRPVSCSRCRRLR